MFMLRYAVYVSDQNTNEKQSKHLHLFSNKTIKYVQVHVTEVHQTPMFASHVLIPQRDKLLSPKNV